MKNNTTGQPICFTQAAALKAKSLVEEEGNKSLNLRVSIEGAGCSGFKYNLTFDQNINEDDLAIKSEGSDDSENAQDIGNIKLLVDAMSLQYLQGAEIDYRQDIHGEQFVIWNPNVKTRIRIGG